MPGELKTVGKQAMAPALRRRSDLYKNIPQLNEKSKQNEGNSLKAEWLVGIVTKAKPAYESI